jgi:superfamily II DNA or RNA helicase
VLHLRQAELSCVLWDLSTGAERVSYADFLASKKRRVAEQGVELDRSLVHPILFDWQAEIVRWAIRRGRAAIFADCGLGKTFMQLEWARMSADRTLILAPLSVARQTVREASKIDQVVHYVRDPEDVVDPGIYITNYEMAHHFDASAFGAVVLDESSILKNVDGPTRRRLTDQFAKVPARLACTATPAPNDVAELCNHAEFLGILPRAEMLASFFVHDDEGWRLKGHAAEPMHEWMAQWATALRRPSDLGWPDDGFDLPELRVFAEVVDVDIEADGQLFATDLGGVGGRSKVRRETLTERCDRAIELAQSTDDQWIIWCGLNDEADRIARAIPDAVNVQGSTSPDDKAEALESFQDGAIRVLVTKPQIAGFGMNFQQCHRMAFVGLNDSYEAYYQAVRRCWRFGQTEPVDVHIVVSPIERQIVDNVRRKESEASSTTEALIRYSNVRASLAKAGV